MFRIAAGCGVSKSLLVGIKSCIFEFKQSRGQGSSGPLCPARRTTEILFVVSKFSLFCFCCLQIAIRKLQICGKSPQLCWCNRKGGGGAKHSFSSNVHFWYHTQLLHLDFQRMYKRRENESAPSHSTSAENVVEAQRETKGEPKTTRRMFTLCWKRKQGTSTVKRKIEVLCCSLSFLPRTNQNRNVLHSSLIHTK